MDKKPLILIFDGMSVLFRAFYAMGGHLTGPEGVPIGAVYGFLKVFFKLIREKEPTHSVVCWDLKDKTFREDLFEDYKANRGPPPDDLIPQIHLIKDVLDDLCVPQFSKSGYEADDLAASVANFFEHHGECFLVTLDKDYMQLVNDKTRMISLKKGDEYVEVTKDGVIDYFGVPPEKVIDVLSLIGDKVDNIPGVPGIGPKTASKLINDYQSIDNLLDNIHSMKSSKVKKSIEDHKDKMSLARKLVTIKKDIDLDLKESSLRYDLENLRSKVVNSERLVELKMKTLIKPFKEMQNNTHLGTKLLLEKDASQNESTAWEKDNYKMLDNKDDIEEFFHALNSSKGSFISFDTETTGLDIFNDFPIGVSFCYEKGQAAYIPLYNKDTKTIDNWKIDLLKDFFQGTKKALVAHNLKFDLHMLKNIDLTIDKVTTGCTMVFAWILDPSFSGGYSLDNLSLRLLNLEKIPTTALIGKESGRSSMLEVPKELLTDYACEDADATFRLMSYIEEHFYSKRASSLARDVEMPVLKLLLEMERSGVSVDEDHLRDMSLKIEQRISEIETFIFKEVGYIFKISSPKQLGQVLFEDLKVHDLCGFKGKLKKTTQGFKTDASVLKKFNTHPIVASVQEHRELNKLLSTYISVLPKLIHPKTKKVHTTFNQIGTATGRLSSFDPNLQNIPIKTPLGQEVRKAFIPFSSNDLIVSADYSQIELRVLAHLSKDEVMQEAFKTSADFHRKTAAQILSKEEDDVTKLERSQAKAINFGIIYGMGPLRLAQEQKISLKEAKAFIEKYFLQFPKIKSYLEDRKKEAHKNGYAETLLGRRRFIPQLKSVNQNEVRLGENVAINTPIQGSAADIMKLGMKKVYAEIKKRGLNSEILIQVHDELVLNVPKSELDEITELLKSCLETVIEFSVPLKVDVKSGNNWLEA